MVGNLPDLAIIGPGKVGTSIALLAKRNGYHIAAIGGRDHEKCQEAASVIGGDVKACTPAEATALAMFVLITVSDDAIESLVADLARNKAFAKHQVVTHVSGALGSEVLTPAKQLGAKIGSAHPLQMFPSVQAALAAMPGSHWYLEGDYDALKALEKLVERIGGLPHVIEGGNKTLYHCASVVASNYLTTLMDLALNIAERAGLERESAWESLSPLVHATIANVSKSGTANALTGPIARGDVETVRRHLEALKKEDPEISKIYQMLGERTIQLALQKGTINHHDASVLRQMLT